MLLHISKSCVCGAASHASEPANIWQESSRPFYRRSSPDEVLARHAAANKTGNLLRHFSGLLRIL